MFSLKHDLSLYIQYRLILELRGRACHRGRPDSILAHSMWDLRFFCKDFSFLSVSFRLCSILISSLDTTFIRTTSGRSLRNFKQSNVLLAVGSTGYKITFTRLNLPRIRGGGMLGSCEFYEYSCDQEAATTEYKLNLLKIFCGRV